MGGKGRAAWAEGFSLCCWIYFLKVFPLNSIWFVPLIVLKVFLPNSILFVLFIVLKVFPLNSFFSS